MFEVVSIYPQFNWFPTCKFRTCLAVARLLVAPPVSWGGERCAMPSERCFGQLPFGHGSSMEDEDFPFLNGMDIQLIWWPSCCQALRQKHETHWIGFLGKILTGNQRFSHDFPMKYWFFRLEFSFKTNPMINMFRDTLFQLFWINFRNRCQPVRKIVFG